MRGLILTLVLPAFLVCGGSAGAGGATSPEDAFKKAVEAARAENFKQALPHLTVESQKVITGASVMMVVSMKDIAKFIDADPKDFEDVLKKHGIDADKVMGELKAIKGGKMNPKEELAAATNLARHVANGPVFISDALALMKKLDKGKGNDIAAELKDAAIKDVKVDGDKATATVTIKGISKQLPFVREAGSWRIDIVPLILSEAAGAEKKESSKENKDK